MNLRESVPFQRTTRIALALLLVLSHPLWAATIIVDETTCTLVDAITAANTDGAVGGCTAGSGADTIELTTDVTLTEVNNSFDGNNGLPVVESEITIEGGGFSISRDTNAPSFRLLYVTGTLSLSNTTLTNGSFSHGGGIRSIGGSLALTNSVLSSNQRNAIYSSGGTVTLIDTLLFNNSSQHSGGAVFIAAGTLIMNNTTLSGNSAGSGGGGIAVGGLATANITNSTLSGNEANWGGGIALSDSYLTMTNSTLSGNSATGTYGGGGGIDAYAGTAILTNSTIVGNSSIGSALSAGIESSFSLANSIVANVASTANNCIGGIIDLGNNFADDDTCSPGFADITPGVDFDTTLAANGGPTQTHALLSGSVAIDAAGECGLATDQRGFPRDDGECDSGSFEFQDGGDGGGGAVPASSRVGLLILLAVLVTTSWAILRPKSRTRRPT
jgi:hypothetical protein